MSTLHEILQSIGINPAVLYAGGLGGVLRALSRRKFNFREMVVTPICGALSAAYLTIPAVHYARAMGWPMPEDGEQVLLASAFLIGTCGMWVSDIVTEIVAKRFKAKDSPP